MRNYNKYYDKRVVDGLCSSHDGFDQIPYDLAEKITDVGFVAPIIVPNFLVVVFYCESKSSINMGTSPRC
jgi:hypothetical protein